MVDCPFPEELISGFITQTCYCQLPFVIRQQR
jgi:hypothetical protein